MDPYLKTLRWFLKREEKLEAVAFVYGSRTFRLEGVTRGKIGKRVDAAWDALGSKRVSGVVEKLTEGIFISVTDKLVMIAEPNQFLRKVKFPGV